jgi:hypothetical protein
MTEKIESTTQTTPEDLGVKHEKFATDLHHHVWLNLTFAEQKAGFVFVLSSGLLVYLNKLGSTS